MSIINDIAHGQTKHSSRATPEYRRKGRCVTIPVGSFWLGVNEIQGSNKEVHLKEGTYHENPEGSTIRCAGLTSSRRLMGGLLSTARCLRL
jgi:hypothetical protein